MERDDVVEDEELGVEVVAVVGQPDDGAAILRAVDPAAGRLGRDDDLGRDAGVPPLGEVAVDRQGPRQPRDPHDRRGRPVGT